MGWFDSEKMIGILDPEGLERNPLTGKKGYSDFYKARAKDWSNYPVYLSGAERLINVIRDNRVMVFESGTGSGKTVLIPKFALHAVNYKGRVVVTVPKSLIASGQASWNAKLMDATLGKEVGFKHRGSHLEEEDAELKGDTASYSEDTKLLFATGGTLVQILNNNPSLDDYSVVIIDEAHERGSDVDETLLFMREALRLNKKLKLIIMSATLPNRKLFLDYFEEFNPYYETLSGKSNFPVKIINSDKNYIKQKDAIEESVKILFDKIIGKKKEGDVLIFVTSGPMGKKIIDEVKKRDPSIFTGILTKNTRGNDLDLLTSEHLYKDYDDLKQRRPPVGWSRRVVAGTNVAESSVTIDGLMFVIDNGMELKSDFDADRQKEILKNQMITQAQATQRAGRVGRIAPGTCYQMYTKETFEEMEPSQKVAILSQDMTDSFLGYLTSPRIKDLLDLVRFVGNLIEHPTKENTLASIRNLLSLNLISHFDVHGSGKLTDEGRMVADIKKEGKIDDLRMAKALMVSRYFRCEEVIIIISAALSVIDGPVSGLFENAFGSKKTDREESIRFFQHPYGDLFSIYRVVTRYSDAANRLGKGELNKWCRNHFLNENTLRKIRAAAIEINKKTWRKLSKIEQMNDEYYFKTCEEAALFSLLKGYFPNICKKVGKGDLYVNFYPKKKTTSSFDSMYNDSFFAFLPKSKLPVYMFYLRNFTLDKNNTFQFCNVIPLEMIKLLKPYELNTLEGLKI